MKARVFPKLDIPEDLYILEQFIGHYDTVQEQIDFLKYAKLELELHYEALFEDDYDALDTKLYNELAKVLDKKIKLYEDIFQGGEKRESRSTNENFGLFNFDLEKIKELAGKYRTEEALLYLKYVLKEFDREKRENNLLFLTREDIEYSKKEFIKLTNDEEYTNVNLWGIGEKQKLAIENFEKNILNEIDFLSEKNKVLQKNTTTKIIDEPMDYEEMLDTYFEYGKECYLYTWKDELQFLTFEKKMIDRYGDKIKQHTYQLYNFISKKTNPIEFIRCNVSQFIYQPNNEKLKNEIIRIDNYIKELEKLEYNTSDEKNMNNIPEDELEKYEEWQCYYIEKIKYEELVEWIDILRKNRPGVTDYKYGEIYQIEFKKVIDFALNELNNYKDKIFNLKNSTEVNAIHKSTETKPKTLWKMTKSEFARFIQETYNANKKDYKSLRDANNKLFEEYEFEDKNWTKEKCYDLVRQT